jgi:hypothetical protein
MLVLNQAIIEYEVKRNNRFVLEFESSLGIESFCVQSITKPKYKNGEWEDIEIILTDFISPAVTQGLFKLINVFENYKSSDLLLFTNQCILNLIDLDPVGVGISKMEIVIDELNIDFGHCDYSDDNITQIKIGIKPKYVRCIY